MAKRQIKITSKATVKRTIRWEQRVQTQYTQPQIIYQESQYSIPTAPTQKALDNLSNQVKIAQKQLSAAARRRSIPSGVYSRPVEDLFHTLDERRKSEELEASAMYDVFISHEELYEFTLQVQNSRKRPHGQILYHYHPRRFSVSPLSGGVLFVPFVGVSVHP
jgi:hypothetical protein